jgi:hypothetical protein
MFAALYMGGCGGSGGASSGNTATGFISAAQGGTLTSSDGLLTLTIPPGALSQSTIITITTINNEGAVEYDLQPSGLTFQTPATVDLQMDLSNQGTLLDENGDPLDIENASPSALILLQNADGTFEAVDNVAVSTEEGSTILNLSMPISHFTSMTGTVGNGYYVYMTSLGTHYVGSDFKADVTVRYLGYTATSSYLNMSITYKLRSITVTKIKIEAAGQIDLVTPAELTRNDFLSQRGQESATRPKFNCKDPGDGTATVTVSVSGTVEVTFQPENTTRVFTVNQTETTTRKAKCIAPYIGQNGNFNDGGEEGVRVAVNDPSDDMLVDEGGVLVSAAGFDLPGYVDMTMAYVGILDGNTLEANFLVGGAVPDPNPSDIPLTGFNLLVLDASVGDTGNPAFEDGSQIISVEGAGADTALASSLSQWDGSAYQTQEGVEFDMNVTADVVSLLIPLSDLGMTGAEAESANYRAATQFETDTYPGADFYDLADIAF